MRIASKALLAAAAIAGAGVIASPASARTFVSIGIGAPVYPRYYRPAYYPGYYYPPAYYGPVVYGGWYGPHYYGRGYRGYYHRGYYGRHWR
jgi:hypothetical protein